MENFGAKALVTGGSHGIGRGIAYRLAEHGYDVALTYRSREEEALEVQRRIQARGRNCVVIQASLQEKGVPQRTVEKAIQRLGGLDLLVCNAGVTRFTSVLNITEEEIDRLFQLDYKGYILCCKAAARYMVQNGTKGSIVCITSSRGLRAYPEDLLYGGMKAAVERSCKSMALELSVYGIRVNCVAPGGTATGAYDKAPETKFDRFVPMGRIGTPGEIGEAVAYLASPQAGYITGATLCVDGGLTLAGFPESLPDSARWIDSQWVAQQRAKMEEG